VPIAAWGQQADRVRRIGVLMVNAEQRGRSFPPCGIEQSLAKLGWTVGRNLRIDYRWDVVDAEKVTAASSKLLAQKPDLVLASTSGAVSNLMRMSRTVSIVFVLISDPIEQGSIQISSELGTSRWKCDWLHERRGFGRSEAISRKAFSAMDSSDASRPRHPGYLTQPSRTTATPSRQPR
jgi:hypothetical protein